MELDILKVLNSRKEVLKTSDSKLHFNKFVNQIRSDDTNILKFADNTSELIKSDDGLTSHTFRISSETPDRVGDIMRVKGCLPHIKNYRNNPIVFFNHKQTEFPVAKAEHPNTKELSVWIKDNSLYATAYFHCLTEESEKLYELIKLGYIRSTSIGFRPIKASLLRYERDDLKDGQFVFVREGLLMEEWDLTEFSPVGVPCNPEATDGLKSWLGKNFKDNEFYRELKSGIPESNITVVPMFTPELNAAIDLAIKPIQDAINTAEENLKKKEDEVLEVKEEVVTEVKEETVVKEPEVQSTETSVEVSVDVPKNIVSEDKLDILFKEMFDKMTKTIEEQISALKTNKDENVISLGTTIPTEVVSEVEKKKKVPFGVEVLNKVMGHMCSSCDYIMDKLDQIDNPKTKPFVQEIHSGITTLNKVVKKFGQKNYPEHFPKEDKKDLDITYPSMLLKSLVEDEATVEVPVAVDPAKKAEEEKNKKIWLQIANSLKEMKELKVLAEDKLYSLTGK